MTFNSLYFILIFPFIVAGYYLLSPKWKTCFLFGISLVFYGCFHWKYVFLLLGVIFLGYYSGKLLEKSNGKKKEWILYGTIAAIISLLVFYKYLNFLLEIGNGFLSLWGMEAERREVSLLIPVGISFFTLVSVGYLIDVYRGNIKAEKNFVAYGAFVSFFPPLLSGPIERAGNLLCQMKEEKHFSEPMVKHGFYRMLWGYFQKVVIADRIAVMVSSVYDQYEEFTGIYILAVTILYAFQIYCDFAGYSNLAIGVAEVLGFNLRQNFKKPYLATDISEFWKRWHISLSSWLRDYVYISLGGNRQGKVVKYRNLIITFLISGLWHGANVTFLIWGLLHGIYSIFFDLVSGWWKEWKNGFATIIKTGITFLLVDFAWLFFRASSVEAALGMIRKIFFDFQPLSILNRDMAIAMKMEMADIGVLILGLLILMIVEFAALEDDLKKKIMRLPRVIRWSFCYIVIFFLLIFGYYGPEFDLGQFIYAQF